MRWPRPQEAAGDGACRRASMSAPGQYGGGDKGTQRRAPSADGAKSSAHLRSARVNWFLVDRPTQRQTAGAGSPASAPRFSSVRASETAPTTRSARGQRRSAAAALKPQHRRARRLLSDALNAPAYRDSAGAVLPADPRGQRRGQTGQVADIERTDAARTHASERLRSGARISQGSGQGGSDRCRRRQNSGSSDLGRAVQSSR